MNARTLIEAASRSRSVRITLHGPVADIAARHVRNTGEFEWTDGATSKGPYLPPKVEQAIVDQLPDAIDPEAWTARAVSTDMRDREAVVFAVSNRT